MKIMLFWISVNIMDFIVFVGKYFYYYLSNKVKDIFKNNDWQQAT